MILSHWHFSPDFKNEFCLITSPSQSLLLLPLGISVKSLPTLKFHDFPAFLLVSYPIPSLSFPSLFRVGGGWLERCGLGYSRSVVTKRSLGPSHLQSSFLNFLCALASSAVITHLVLK